MALNIKFRRRIWTGGLCKGSVLVLKEIRNTDYAGSRGNTADLHSRGNKFESRREHLNSRLMIFFIFLTISRQILGYYLKLGIRHFGLRSLQFVIHDILAI
jgi:hypothetical protein